MFNKTDELRLKELVFERIVKAKNLIDQLAGIETTKIRQEAIVEYYGEKLSNIIEIIKANPTYLSLQADNKELILPLIDHLEMVISIKREEKKGHLGPFYIAFPNYAYVKSRDSTKDLDLYEPVNPKLSVTG